MLPEALLAEARVAHATPGRAYHDWSHVRAVLARHDEVAREGPGWRAPRETRLALLFHDAVYVAGRADNEAESARLARTVIPRHLDGVDLERVAALIELTARHGGLVVSDVDDDAALFLDCDMAVLGGAPENFDAYDRGVASEYAAVPADLYRAGRRRFLARLLASERIFLSDFFHARLDAAARANLRRALATL
jgi:predicted metal-dependent HD superfamily phosphohydrolase